MEKFEKFKKYIIGGALVGLLFLPQITSAQIWQTVGAALGEVGKQLEEIYEPIMIWLLIFLAFLGFGIIALWTVTSFLEIFITKQTDWLEALFPVTQAGFNYIVGLVNMFLVLIFIIIAFAFIFKIETFQAKKTLPRLIIVALLLNFSLLFVNMMIDISQIVYNTILQAGGDHLFSHLLEVLLAIGLILYLGSMTLIAVVVGLTSLPVIGGVAKIIIGFLTAPFIIPFLSFLLFLGMFFLLLALPLGILTFLFGARIFILQILGIFAPLAFLCLILPQTKKYWSDWLKHLVEWLTLGIVCLFFLVVGFKTLQYMAIEVLFKDNVLNAKNLITLVFPMLAPFTHVNPIKLLFDLIKSEIIFYFVLFIYMSLIIYLCKSLTPVLAKVLIEQGKAMGGLIWARAVKPYGAYMGSLMRRAAIEEEARGKSKAEERGLQWEGLGLRERLRIGKAGYALTLPVRWTHRYILATTPEEEEKRKMAEVRAEAEKIKDPNLLVTKIKDAIRIREYGKAVELTSVGIRKGGGFKKLIEQKISEEEAIRLGREANIRGATEEAERIGRTFIEYAHRMGFRPLDAADMAKGYTNIQRKLIGEAKGDAIKDFATRFWRSPAAMEAIQLFWGGPQLGRAAEEFGRELVEDYMRYAEARPRPVRWFLENNPRALLYLAGTAAQDLGYRSIGGLSQAEMRELIHWWRVDRPRGRPFRRRP